MEQVVFVLAALGVLVSAIGVVFSKHPVHSALSLVATLFGIAVLFVAEGAHFLAAVQVIVYAGAIVVLFLFVIMLLGVDRVEDLETEPLTGQRPAALVAGVGILAVSAGALLLTWRDFDHAVAIGATSSVGAIGAPSENLQNLAHAIFTDYLFAFEITSVLLVIAVVGAVVLARRAGRPLSEEDAVT